MEFVREPPRLAPHRPHYRLVAQLAQGGMGEVFVGRELGPKAQPGAELVAIKTLLPEAARNPMMLTRFLDEARLSARLDLPNVAKMRDFDQAEGRPFAVYELLEGADLDEVLFQLRRSGRTMSIEVAVALIIEACQGLQHAHTLKKDGVPLEVVHRDLSPSKLFLTATGELKVLDFGAAWNRDRVTMTATGRVIGKFDYMSPE